MVNIRYRGVTLKQKEGHHDGPNPNHNPYRYRGVTLKQKEGHHDGLGIPLGGEYWGLR